MSLQAIFPRFLLLAFLLASAALSNGAAAQAPSVPGKPAPAKPQGPSPAPSKPAEKKPEPVKPSPGKPADQKPAPAKPGEVKPEPAKPAPQKPADAKPAPNPAPAAGSIKSGATPPVASGAPKAESSNGSNSPSSSAAAKRKSVQDVVKGHKRLAGLFDIYLDQEKGGVHLYVRRDQIGREFIHFSQTLDGVVQAGHHRGSYGSEMVFRIQAFYERLEWIAENTSFYFDPTSALSKAGKANISHSVMASEPIVASDDGGYLISANSLFLREVFRNIRPSMGSTLGRLSESKTKFLSLRTYRDNVSLAVEYVFENGSPPRSSDGDRSRSDEITDARNISIRVQHHLIAMPKNDYKPRFDDPRLGFFTTEVNDMTSTSSAPYRDVIHRWHLVKKKPGTALSEPVEPIVFWMENTTPVEWRDTIREAALRWNQAFASAGFKDALVVRMQPDNADWDAGDINYNVLRWTSSPNPPFGGYGPSFVNPRTGQILGADIMLEFSFLTNRLRAQRVFTEMGLASEPAWRAQTGFDAPRHWCEEQGFAQQGFAFGQVALNLAAAQPEEIKALSREAVAKLILHEIGHTLGLNHNFRASTLHDAKNIHRREITSKTALTGSVMDYMPANIAPIGQAQGEYYITKPGPYDHWAIEYGYSEALEDPAQEKKRLAALAGRSHEPALAFGNDADDMRRAGKGIDPRVMTFDMSGDPIQYGIDRCELVKQRMQSLLEKLPAEGRSWQDVLAAYLTLSRESADALVSISRWVGGVQVERAFKGQIKGRGVVPPYQPVERAKQLAALDAMAKYAFAPGAQLPPPTLIAHLQQQRRGFEFFKEDEAPRIHDRVLTLQRALLDHLLHVETQRRILDSALYGNTLGLNEVMDKLTAAIMRGDPASGPDSLRQALQQAYLASLIRISAETSGWPAGAQAASFGQLLAIQGSLEAPGARKGAHEALLLRRIRKAVEAKD
jgi:hypothetical protein